MGIKKEENIPCIKTAIGDAIPCFETQDGSIKYDEDTITFAKGEPMTFKNITFRNLNIKGTIQEHKFINCKFEDCNFRCKTTECDFTNCQLEGCHLGTFIKCKFSSCNLVGIVDAHIHIDYNEFDEVTGNIKYCDTTNLPHNNTFTNMCFDGFIELFQYGRGTCKIPREYWPTEKGKHILIWGGKNIFKGATLTLNKLRELCNEIEIIVSANRFFHTINDTTTQNGNLITKHFNEIAHLCIYLKGMPEELKAALIYGAFNANQEGTVEYTISDDGENYSIASTTEIRFHTEARPCENGYLTIFDDNGGTFKGELPKIDVTFKDPEYNPCQRYCGNPNQVITMTATNLKGVTIPQRENVLNPGNYKRRIRQL